MNIKGPYKEPFYPNYDLLCVCFAEWKRITDLTQFEGDEFREVIHNMCLITENLNDFNSYEHTPEEVHDDLWEPFKSLFVRFYDDVKSRDILRVILGNLEEYEKWYQRRLENNDDEFYI